jgi:hypothetical protein
MARDGEHFFMCFLAICTSSFEKLQLICPFLHLVIDFFGGEFSFLSSMYILVINPLFDVSLAKVFSHSVGENGFNVETISFVGQKLFNFM